MELYILIILFHNFIEIKSYTIYMKLPEINEKYIKTNSHLNLTSVKVLCENKEGICKSNNTRVCSVRHFNGEKDFREFENSCYMFMENMCVHPGNEYHIITGETCKSYMARRHAGASQDTIQDAEGKPGEAESNVTIESSAPGLRAKANTTFSTLYDIDTAFDNHICPLSCPETYEPVCISANRGFGKYFKFFTFINHCLGDLYYCKNWEEFSPPPDEDSEMVTSSPLGWSFCGASRYLALARFSEVVSSMGHYGWLAGDQRYSHIMEPYQRVPGFGRK